MCAVVRIVWVAIAAICVAVIFPPYGFTHERVRYIAADVDPDAWDRVDVNAWRYVAHSFILGPVPRAKTDWSKLRPEPRVALDSRHAEVRIAWHILLIEVGLIVLLTGGVAYTARVRKAGGPT